MKVPLLKTMILPIVTEETILECHNEVVNNPGDIEPFEKMKQDNPYLVAYLRGALSAKGMNVEAMFAIAVTMYDALDRQAEKDNLSEVFG